MFVSRCIICCYALRLLKPLKSAQIAPSSEYMSKGAYNSCACSQMPVGIGGRVSIEALVAAWSNESRNDLTIAAHILGGYSLAYDVFHFPDLSFPTSGSVLSHPGRVLSLFLTTTKTAATTTRTTMTTTKTTTRTTMTTTKTTTAAAAATAAVTGQHHP